MFGSLAIMGHANSFLGFKAALSAGQSRTRPIAASYIPMQLHRFGQKNTGVGNFDRHILGPAAIRGVGGPFRSFQVSGHLSSCVRWTWVIGGPCQATFLIERFPGHPAIHHQRSATAPPSQGATGRTRAHKDRRSPMSTALTCRSDTQLMSKSSCGAAQGPTSSPGEGHTHRVRA